MSHCDFCSMRDIFRSTWRSSDFQKAGGGQILYFLSQRRQTSGIANQAAHLRCARWSSNTLICQFYKCVDHSAIHCLCKFTGNRLCHVSLISCWLSSRVVKGEGINVSWIRVLTQSLMIVSWANLRSKPVTAVQSQWNFLGSVPWNRVHLEENVHGAKQGGLQALWGIGFKMILKDWTESEIN